MTDPPTDAMQRRGHGIGWLPGSLGREVLSMRAALEAALIGHELESPFQGDSLDHLRAGRWAKGTVAGLPAAAATDSLPAQNGGEWQCPDIEFRAGPIVEGHPVD